MFRGVRWRHVLALRGDWRLGRFGLGAGESGAQNVFNVFPDRNSTVNSFNGIQTFPSQSPFGFSGRALYARLAWTF